MQLTIDQSKVYKAICYFAQKYEQAFPSIPMIAKVAGMCTRKCADHIKELVEMGRIRKHQRWANGRQLSNAYEIVEEQPQVEQQEQPKKPHADYKNLDNNFNKQDDDYKITHANQLDFVQLAQRMGVTLPVLKKIYPRIKQDLIDCNYFAMRTAIHQYLMFKDNISSIPAWFKEVLSDWKIRLRTSSAPART